MFDWLFSIVFPSVFKNRPFFLVSDLHFGHAQIIELVNRPFPNVYAMNTKLVQNWNGTVTDGDIVWCLGDFVGGRNIGHWINKLNGRISFIKGNHDKFLRTPYHHKLIRYRGYWFLLIHDPKKTPFWWRLFFNEKGWIIHGHTHNHEFYPFINGKRKRINVSVERIDYKPISINEILSLCPNTIWRIEKRNSNPVYRYSRK